MAINVITLHYINFTASTCTCKVQSYTGIDCYMFYNVFPVVKAAV